MSIARRCARCLRGSSFVVAHALIRAASALLPTPRVEKVSTQHAKCVRYLLFRYAFDAASSFSGTALSGSIRIIKYVM